MKFFDNLDLKNRLHSFMNPYQRPSGDEALQKFLSGEFLINDLFRERPGAYKFNFTYSDFDRIGFSTYVRSADFREAVDLIWTQCAELPLCLTNLKKEKKDLTDKLLMFLNRPMNNTSWEGFVEQILVQKYISGEIFLYNYQKGKRDDVMYNDFPNLFLVWPSEVLKVKWVDGLPYSYKVSSQFFDRNKIEKPDRLELEGRYERGKWISDIAYYKKPNPIGKEGRGLAPCAPLFNDIQIIVDGKLWNMNLLKNSGVPSLALFYPDKHPAAMGMNTSSQFVGKEKVEEEIVKKVSGPENAGKVLFLQGGLQAKELSFKPKDIDYLAGLRHSRENIFSLLHIPLIMATNTASTYNNVKEARQSFTMDTCVPLWNSILAWLSKEVLIPYGIIEDETLRLAVDLEATEVANTLRLEKIKALQAEDALTTNEKREALNYAPSEEDNANKILINQNKKLLEEVGLEEEFGQGGEFGEDPEQGENNGNKKPKKEED